MKKWVLAVIALCLLPLIPACAVATLAGMRPVTITVIDTEGEPVEDANVYASLPFGGPARGVTDEDGKVHLMIHNEATLYLTVQKMDYYETGGEVFRGGYDSDGKGGLKARKAKSEYTVELKEIRNPVSMHEGVIRKTMPYDKGPLLFDMMENDWVAPYGRGKIGYLIFNMREAIQNDEMYSFILEISFPNEGDGIQPFFARRPFSIGYGSNQAPPYQAPMDGYEPTFNFVFRRKAGEPYKDSAVKNRNFIFRTMTQKDASGQIVSAYHGWLLGDLDFSIRKNNQVEIVLFYYFNPDPDMATRSLEYDQFAKYSREQMITEEQLKADAERPPRELR